MLTKIYNQEASGAFVETFVLEPYQSGVLNGLKEFANTVGGWIETVKPELGPNFKAAYQNVQDFDRTGLNNALYLCESLFQKIAGFTNVGDLFCFPTTPTIAPKKGSLSSLDSVMAFYGRTMAISSFAGVGRLPEISIPAAHIDGIPVGVSLAAGNYQDEFLLDAAKHFIMEVLPAMHANMK